MNEGSTDDLANNLRAIVGANGVLDQPHDVDPYRGDIGRISAGVELIVVRPRDVHAVSAVIRACVSAGVSITPRGGGTGFCGGAAPDGIGMNVVVSFERMRQVRSIDTIGDVMIVEAGCTLADAQRAAAAEGRLLGIDHGGAGSSQIGGNLSTNAGGNNVLRYGMAREQVLGLEVVLADGRVLSRLSPLRKNNAGYDLKQLFLGGEGTLGLITAAALRLRPVPQKYATACVALETPDEALTFLVRARALLGESISACELMSNAAVSLYLRSRPDLPWPCDPATPWFLLIEADSTSPWFDIDAAFAALMEQSLESGILTGGTIAANDAQRRALWGIREGIAASMVATPGCLKSDTAVPISQIPEFIMQAERAVTSIVQGCRAAPFGHLGDGNIHFNVLPPDVMAVELFQAQTQRLASAIADVSLALGGTVSAEHGIGSVKRTQLAKMMTSTELDLMLAIKRAWDPGNLFNQQKILLPPRRDS